ncbi:hypothetical protein [Gordonia sp. MP11Mi]|uniref:Uncharacterized protein n=1 Tax=Gordonia sp. MP11Mi TaxID=3022769 RepID=A0AA97CU78_9ACTN
MAARPGIARTTSTTRGHGSLGSDDLKVTDLVDAPHACCICCEQLPEWPLGANNPYPVTADGACCNSCNRQVVIPAREDQ